MGLAQFCSGQNFLKNCKKALFDNAAQSLEGKYDRKWTQIWIFIVLVASLLPYFGVKVGFRCISVHIWLSNQVCISLSSDGFYYFSNFVWVLKTVPITGRPQALRFINSSTFLMIIPNCQSWIWTNIC